MMNKELADFHLHVEAEITREFILGNSKTLLDPIFPKYVKDITSNLIHGVELDDFEIDLRQGAGSELLPENNNPPKFCATFSSSALCVNCFAPFRHHPERLDLLGHNGFAKAKFEQKFPTGLPGIPPHLDFYAESPSVAIAIESKFTEFLKTKIAKFKPTYEDAFTYLAEPPWRAMYSLLKSAPNTYTLLDAAQLCKHYLGLQNSLKGNQNIILLYLFWEPNNAKEFSLYRIHREEIKDFSERISGSNILFTAMSYPELWQFWDKSEVWDGINKHLSNLRTRYLIDILGKSG